MKFDFTRRPRPVLLSGCTGRASCVSNTTHQPGCPKLAKDLARFKAARNRFYDRV